MKTARSIRDLHEKLTTHAKSLSKEVEEHLIDYAEANKWVFNSRIKELVSFAQKIEAGFYPSIDKIDDFYACEIVVPSMREIEPVKQYIHNNFDFIDERPKKVTNVENFSFDGVRMYVRLKVGVAGPKFFSWMMFEIQVKTLLEKAWGEATHDLTYKCKEVDWAKERLAYQLRAILNHADIVLSEMESISENCLTSVTSQTHDEINTVSSWIFDTWGESSCPKNMKRLSETVNKLCKTYQIEFNDLKEIIKNHMAEHGRREDLSIYSRILEAVLDSDHDRFWNIAKKKPGNHWQLKLTIPPEIEIDTDRIKRLHEKRFILVESLEPPTS